MDKVDKNLYNKEFDKMFKLDKDGAMTNIDCYVCNLKNKINILNKGIDELIEKYQDKLQSLTWIKTISLEANEHNQNSNIKKECYKKMIQDLKKLKGE